MGEGKEMPEEDGGVNQQQQGKNYKVVGLQTDEQHNHQPMENQGIEKDANARTVEILAKGEINDSCQEQQEKECEHQQMPDVQLGVIGPMEVHHLPQMLPEGRQHASHDGNAPIEPIGKEDGQQGCHQTTQREGSEESLNLPINQHHPQELGEDEGGRRKDEMDKEGKRRLGLLIGGKEWEERKQSGEHEDMPRL